MKSGLAQIFLNLAAMTALLMAMTVSAMAQPSTGEGIEPQLPDMEQPLSEQPGDPERGMNLFADPQKGNCIACHMVRRIENANNQGTIGRPLDGIAAKYSEAEFRQIIADVRKIFPNTEMPPYFVTNGLYRVETRYRGKSILSAVEIEDIISFLRTLN